MNDPFKYQYKSQNLARLQEIFVNDTTKDLKMNYTITNKSIKSPLKGMNLELVTAKPSDVITPTTSFVKKYNKVLNEFCLPNGQRYITIDLDEKLKLNYLQSQIEEKKKQGYKPSNKSQLDEIKNNYIIGSPIRNGIVNNNLNFTLSPRAAKKKEDFNFIKESNMIKDQSYTKVVNLSSSQNKFDCLNRIKENTMSKATFSKKEIINSLFDDEKTQLKTIDKINKLKASKSVEKDLRKKVMLTESIPNDIKIKLKKNFPDYIKQDYVKPKPEFPSGKLNYAKRRIDKIFEKKGDSSNFNGSTFDRSNRVDFNY